MDLTQLIVISVVQGVTEFLPISSSGHLILAPKLLGWQDQGRLIDTAVHLGSLFAVLLYFQRETRDAMVGPFYLVGDLASGRPIRWESKLALLLVVATLPLLPVGFAIAELQIDEAMRGSVALIGWTTLLFGVALYWADRFSPETHTIKQWSFGGAILLGLAQVLALVPGTSRSGVTMTAARFLGYSRTEAARISMLMAIPAILAASAKGGLDLVESGDLKLTTDAVIAATLSFLSAYLALVLMMRMLSRFSFTPFVLYRIVLGCALLWAAYGAPTGA